VAQTRDVISKTVLGDLQTLDKVKAASLGGGPGAECIALADILDDNGCQELRFRSFDIEESWRAYFDVLSQRFGAALENLVLDSRFIRRNLLVRPTDVRYDVVFVPWVLSEVGEATVPVFANRAISACKNGGHVVVLERKESDLGQVIIHAFENIDGVSRVFSAGNSVKGWCGIFFDDVHRDEFKARLNYQSLYYVFQLD
jgi:hypothetical protein